MNNKKRCCLIIRSRVRLQWKAAARRYSPWSRLHHPKPGTLLPLLEPLRVGLQNGCPNEHATKRRDDLRSIQWSADTRYSKRQHRTDASQSCTKAAPCESTTEPRHEITQHNKNLRSPVPPRTCGRRRFFGSSLCIGEARARDGEQRRRRRPRLWQRHATRAVHHGTGPHDHLHPTRRRPTPCAGGVAWGTSRGSRAP